MRDKSMRAILLVLFILTFLMSCISIPQESIDLSKMIGKDIEKLHQAHRSAITINYADMKDNVNEFIDDVYAPYILKYVLEKEWESYQDNKTSLFKSMEMAVKNEDKKYALLVLDEMADFQKAARTQIARKRKELLDPLGYQEMIILKKLDQSYGIIIYANSTVTGHLESIRNVKNAQTEALGLVGMDGINLEITDKLVELSRTIKNYTEEGKQLDSKADDALIKINEISSKIKKAIN